MPIVILEGEKEKKLGIHYEYDSSEEPIGVGGMGTVYRGKCIDKHGQEKSEVAIKLLNPDSTEFVIERARREASIQIRHENLVEMLGFIEKTDESRLSESGKHYYVVSELLIGVMLDDLLEGKLTDQEGNTVPFAEKLYHQYRETPYNFALYVVRRILSGVMTLHDAGYIHRDIDPTNIMITNKGRIKLIDFGISKKMSTLTTKDKQLTTAGQFMGKAQYAAPELVVGDVRNQNITTDIYAIGIILYQLVVGRPPFQGVTYDVLEMQLHQKVPMEPIKQKNLREVISKATNKTQNMRYQSAAEFRVAVEQLENLKYPDLSIFDTFLSALQSKGKYVAIAAAVIAGLGIGFFAVNRMANGSAQEATEVAEESSTGTNTTGKSQETPKNDTPYDKAVSMLSDKETANAGIQMLEELAKDGDFDATYMLARLYYVEVSADYYVSDEIRTLRKNSGVKGDLHRSHELNVAAVELRPTDYKALYELGCDYVSGLKRTGDRSLRDMRKANQYLTDALVSAKEAGDQLYTRLINTQLNNKVRPNL